MPWLLFAIGPPTPPCRSLRMRVNSAFSAARSPANSNTAAASAPRIRKCSITVHGDQPQDVAVAQRLAPQRQDDLVPRRRVLPDGMLRRGERQPRVAAHAPVPAQAARLAGEHLVLGAQLGRLRAQDLVAVQPAADQLVAQLRAEAPRLLGSRRRHVRRRRSTGAHLPNHPFAGA